MTPLARSAGWQPVLVGCGILRKEVELILREKGWNVSTRFLDSSLHYYFGRLASELQQILVEEEQGGRDPVVLYGHCHPLMDRILAEHHAPRAEGQNCIVMLLGHERFMVELSRGAYFLLEEWANAWPAMMTTTFGPKPEVVREIFHASHRLLLALRTPCSGDFTAAAEEAARIVDLPLEWMDVDLRHLESVLADALEHSREGA